MSLDELRKKIDAADEELLTLLAKRMQLVSQIAKQKKEKGLPVKQPERERQLIEQKRQLARQLGLSEQFAEKVFRAIIDEALMIQEES